MEDRQPLSERESEARQTLVAVAQAMLTGNVSFFEGADQVLRLKRSIGGIADRDPDFDAFLLVQSETDHLPMQAQRHLWNPQALAELEPEFVQTEVWAKSFLPAACRSLIARFSCQASAG